jgi:hypothetical protein
MATLTDCTISGNRIGLDNGGTATLTDCTVSGNGWGIGNYGTLVLGDTIVAGNKVAAVAGPQEGSPPPFVTSSGQSRPTRVTT